jgi:predicted transcriptional regulator
MVNGVVRAPALWCTGNVAAASAPETSARPQATQPEADCLNSRLFQGQPSAEQLVGPLEYACLKVIWRRGSASVGQVLTELNTGRDRQDELAYTTVMTVLVRLHEKGVLRREKEGRGYVYHPVLSESGLVEQLGRQEIDELLFRYGGVAVAQFALAVRELSPSHLAQLRTLIAKEEGDEN